jgi:hypothetical protein
MKASTSSKSHTVTDGPIENGFGNLPSRTQRHTVAGLTGSLPRLAGRAVMADRAFMAGRAFVAGSASLAGRSFMAGVLANSPIRITRCDMKRPLKMRRSAVWGHHVI